MAGADYTLGGPIYWFMVALLVLAGILAAFVVLHSLMVARRGRFAEKPASVWLWAGPQAVYLVLLFVVQGPWLPLIAAAVLVFITPLALIQSLAYLLRVVFPKAIEQAQTVEPDGAEPNGRARASASESPSESSPPAE